MIHQSKPGKLVAKNTEAGLFRYLNAKSNRYSQPATGMVPEDRGKFCAVGIEAADNFSYEM